MLRMDKSFSNKAKLERVEEVMNLVKRVKKSLKKIN